MKHDGSSISRESFASRPPAPRAEFARALADEVRSRGPARTPLARVGLALALSGLIVVALASFGGIGYASSSASHAVKKPAEAARADREDVGCSCAVRAGNAADEAEARGRKPSKPTPKPPDRLRLQP